VAAVSPSNARAVGEYAFPGGENTLVLRWDGTRWAQVPSPDPGVAVAVLYGINASSASNFWAAGFFGGAPADEALTLHCC